MDLSFTNDQEMVRNMAKEFATKELEPKAAEIDEKGEFPHAAIKKMADAALKELSPLFDEMYKDTGRRSVPPERLLPS